METTTLNPARSFQTADAAALARFVEHEAELLDERMYLQWQDLFDEDGTYWVPAQHGQDNPQDHVSIFFDDKTILKTRVSRLTHPMIHCQDPPSHSIRVISNIHGQCLSEADGLYEVRSKFVMVEDRSDRERRIFAGRYRHLLRMTRGGLRIVQKRVDLTNCDQSFPLLAQPI